MRNLLLLAFLLNFIICGCAINRYWGYECTSDIPNELEGKIVLDSLCHMEDASLAKYDTNLGIGHLYENPFQNKYVHGSDVCTLFFSFYTENDGCVYLRKSTIFVEKIRNGGKIKFRYYNNLEGRLIWDSKKTIQSDTVDMEGLKNSGNKIRLWINPVLIKACFDKSYAQHCTSEKQLLDELSRNGTYEIFW